MYMVDQYVRAFMKFFAVVFAVIGFLVLVVACSTIGRFTGIKGETPEVTAQLQAVLMCDAYTVALNNTVLAMERGLLSAAMVARATDIAAEVTPICLSDNIPERMTSSVVEKIFQLRSISGAPTVPTPTPGT